MNRRLCFRIAGFAIGLMIIGLWKFVVDARFVSPMYLPEPARAWSALVNGFTEGELASRLVLTLEHIVLGWLFASIVGVVVGSLLGVSRFARVFIAPMLEIFRPLPAAALFPVAISIFGLNEKMVVAVIGFGAVWPTLLATVHGFDTVHERLRDVRHLLELSRWNYIRKVALPNASPHILAGMRLSLTYALVLSVTGEMLSSSEGLGFWIMQQARSFRADGVFAGVILFGVIGYVTAQLMSVLERWMLRWRENERVGAHARSAVAPA